MHILKHSLSFQERRSGGDSPDFGECIGGEGREDPAVLSDGV